MEYNRICVICGKTFETKLWAQVTCSKECSDIYRKQKAKEYRDSHKSENIKERAPFHRICRICKKPFTTCKNGQFVCSDECRIKSRNEAQKKYYIKKKIQ